MVTTKSLEKTGYWKSCAGSFKNLRVLVVAALFVAINSIIGSFFIQVGENLGIYFTFIINGIGGMIYGPLMSILVGVCTDLLGYVVHPFGAFFPGYTLSTVLGCLIFALFFYRQRISVLRIFLAKLCVNVFVNIMLNCVWSEILYGKGYLYYLAKSIFKNLALLPLEVLMLYLVLRAMIPVINKMKFLDFTYPAHIKWF